MKWIYCNEHMPPAGERVLICTDSFVCEAYASYPDGNRNKPAKWNRHGFATEQLFGQEVIAWMPLPDVPGTKRSRNERDTF